MRVLITAEATSAADGGARAHSLASGWAQVAPEDDIRANALGRAACDFPGDRPIVRIDETWEDDNDVPDTTGCAIVLGDVAASVDFAARWRRLRDRCGGWSGVREWLTRPGAQVFAASPAPLLGADSVLATLALTDPAAAETQRRALTELSDDIERDQGRRNLLAERSRGRGRGTGAGFGIGELAHLLGVDVHDSLAYSLRLLEERGGWDDVDLHVHVGANLNTWDLPDSVVAALARRAGAHAVPVVAVGREITIGARERGSWGIDGTLESDDTPEALGAAGVRLGRTWSIGRR
ncbi:hypothetical protein H8R18_04700 [Nanchangia anserum]|uniref:Uncharacterized protein n=1 Tax=Nanchangia anserum TaxID=2692125 RepID=A0A8I0KQW6_9ACTO|nr:hypothetical protein [Nanchangia anserum]MBD3688852.1 hypothetical protein [Nanchangia anserum]QOX81124.1 hypothetical protein H8R18_04700 [Nanchangia anserum]